MPRKRLEGGRRANLERVDDPGGHRELHRPVAAVDESRNAARDRGSNGQHSRKGHFMSCYDTNILQWQANNKWSIDGELFHQRAPSEIKRTANRFWVHFKKIYI